MARPKPKPHFSPGSAVEISSDEPGFRGSFFLGKVISSLTSPPDSYLVQYETLVAEGSSSSQPPQPLREVASAKQLRPRPPPEPRRKFGTGDEVDVYHNDGWWRAVVTADLGGGRFEVFFGGYKEQMVFSLNDLRLHRECINGMWFPQFEEQEEEEEEEDERTQIEMNVNGNEETTHKKFEKGTLVEVSSDEDGFEGAWFAATIVELVGKKDKFLVQYQTLRTDDEENFLREEIDTLHIRPRPPEIVVVGRFKLLDEVDCLYNDGWWVGVVSEVLGDSRYNVYFKDTKEEMEFHHSDMRLHQEWIDGKWVMASQVLGRL